MDETVPPHAADTLADAGPYQGVLYETARALAESPTLEEAAPRMIEAVCEALGWQCGAIWEVDRARKRPAMRRHVATARSAPFERVHRGDRGVDVRPGRRAARTGLGVAASRPGSPTSPATTTSRAPRRPSAPACMPRSACRSSAGTTVQGVMEFFSRDILEPSPDLLAMMTTVCNQIGLFIERKWARRISTASSRSRSTCSASPPSTATSCGSIRRGRRCSASEEELRTSPFIDFVHPDDRTATVAGAVGADDRRRT